MWVVRKARTRGDIVVVIIHFIDGSDWICQRSRRINGRVLDRVLRVGKIVIARTEIYRKLGRQLDVVLNEDSRTPVVRINPCGTKRLGRGSGLSECVVDELSD